MGLISGVFEAIVVVIAIVISVALGLLISQPFQTSLIRLRANYLPKAVSLDNVMEDGTSSSRRAFAEFIQSSEAKSTAKIGPVVPGIFVMMRRTKRLEGWAGLYKGSVPTAIQLVWLWFITWVIFDTTKTQFGGSYKGAPTSGGHFAFGANLVFMLLMAFAALPLNVITNRVIVHPRILPLNRPMENLQEILSYAELRNPLKLYKIPGLAAATLIHVGWIGIATRVIRQLLVPGLADLQIPDRIRPGDSSWSGPSSDSLKVTTFGIIAFTIWNLLSLPVLAPIECAMVRLSTQRPEKQNPLHLAYAKPSGPAAPSSVSHQASVAQQKPAGADDDLPPGRASFAIEDPDDSDEARHNEAAQEQRPFTDNEQQQSQAAGEPRYLSTMQREPAEPVIALRPCDEADSAEEAARMDREGASFGAPVVERYKGCFDCIRKMREEEGIESLGRGWWVTLTALLLASYV